MERLFWVIPRLSSNRRLISAVQVWRDEQGLGSNRAQSPSSLRRVRQRHRGKAAQTNAPQCSANTDDLWWPALSSFGHRFTPWTLMTLGTQRLTPLEPCCPPCWPWQRRCPGRPRVWTCCWPSTSASRCRGDSWGSPERPTASQRGEMCAITSFRLELMRQCWMYLSEEVNHVTKCTTPPSTGLSPYGQFGEWILVCGNRFEEQCQFYLYSTCKGQWPAKVLYRIKTISSNKTIQAKVK